MEKGTKLIGRFKKGNVPWNKGLKGIHLSPKSEFKPGDRAGDKNNTWKGGIQNNKNDCVYLYKGVGKRVRRPRAVYEEFHGPLTKDYVIYHIDGNKNNDDIKNLEAITRVELLKRNLNKKL